MVIKISSNYAKWQRVIKGFEAIVSKLLDELGITKIKGVIFI